MVDYPIHWRDFQRIACRSQVFWRILYKGCAYDGLNLMFLSPPSRWNQQYVQLFIHLYQLKLIPPTGALLYLRYMNTLHTLLIYCILCINAVTFIIYGIDKYKAKKAKWRIQETTLLLLAVLGGSIGAWFGMKVWHHKTMHKIFKYGVPAILFLQIAAMIYLHMNL